MVRFEDVKDQTTKEYFNNNQFSIDAFNKKYTIDDNETYVQSVKRVCDFVASVEDTAEKRSYWSDQWFDEIYNDWWHPAGSIMQGAGLNKNISLANCFSRDTNFITRLGVKNFYDFNDWDSVEILDSRGSWKLATIKSYGVQELLKVTVQRNTVKKEIYATPEHNWRILEKKTCIVNKTTKELNINDIIPYTKRKSMDNNSGRNICPIGIIHGLVFGDGHFDPSSNTCMLDLCGDSKELIELFQGFSWNIRNSSDNIRISYLPNWFKKFPDFDNINEEYLLGFIAGWLGADGTIDKGGRCELSSATKLNLETIKAQLERVGIYSSQIRKLRDSSPFDGNINHKLYNMYLIKDCLFSNLFIKSQHKKYYDDYISSTSRSRSKLNWKVVSVENTDRLENVWCVEVPEVHNFTLEGGINTGNCTTLSLGLRDGDNEWDNLESIFKNTAYSVAKCAAFRQGLGVDFSRLRPRTTEVNNSARESTGAVNWMRFIDSIAYFVGQKGRIPAFLFSISCDHPDLLEFIDAKKDFTIIQNANISVQCTDKFYKAVEKDDDWELKFEIKKISKGDKVYIDIHSTDQDSIQEFGTNKWYYIAKRDRNKQLIIKTYKARLILELIAKGMAYQAEPGVQNISIARKYSNSDYLYDPDDEYDTRIIGTNACSEQYLSRDSLCVLASINAEKFSTDIDILESEMQIIAPSISRFLDNVNECELKYETYATPHQRLAIQKLRRIGAGYTNLAAWLFKNNLEYGSDDGNSKVEHFTKLYNLYLYKNSIELGKEKGNLGAFNREKLEKSPFIKRMMKLGLEFTHLRNITNSSIAPTGTLTLMFRDGAFSYGIEPAFGIYFWKRTRISGKYEYYFCVPNVVRKLFEQLGRPIPINSDTIKDTFDGKYGKPIADFIDANKKELGINFVNSTEVEPLKKLDLMSKVMTWVDSSISVTYMLPDGSDWKDVYNFIIEANNKGVKSIAAFPDRKMYGIITYISFQDLAVKLMNEGVTIRDENFTAEEINILRGLCSVRTLTQEPMVSRPKEVACDVHHVSVKNTPYFILVGLHSGKPYEIFAGKNGVLDHKVHSGKIIKMKRPRQYKFIGDDDSELTPIAAFSDNEQQAITRLISISLQSGTPIEKIITQLDKTDGDLTSFSKAIIRALKKYIKDGVFAGKCPQCSGDLLYNSGCATCINCEFSKC